MQTAGYGCTAWVRWGMRGWRSGTQAGEENDPKSKAPYGAAERLEGSPPPELPNYACDCEAKNAGCKYVFRNQKVTIGNQSSMAQLAQITGTLRGLIVQFSGDSTFWSVTIITSSHRPRVLTGTSVGEEIRSQAPSDGRCTAHALSRRRLFMSARIEK